MARPSGVLMCLLFAAVFGEFCLTVSEADQSRDQCIKGPLHKKKPSPEERSRGFVECKPWKENSCCTASFTAELKRNNVESLYHFSWNHCANMSQVRWVFQALIWNVLTAEIYISLVVFFFVISNVEFEKARSDWKFRWRSPVKFWTHWCDALSGT